MTHWIGQLVVKMGKYNALINAKTSKIHIRTYHMNQASNVVMFDVQRHKPELMCDWLINSKASLSNSVSMKSFKKSFKER